MRRLMTLLSAAVVMAAVAWTPAAAGVGAHQGEQTSHDVTVYFLVNQPSGGPFLVPVHRSVADGTNLPAQAVRLLLGGPTAAETAATMSTAVPVGTTLNRVHVEDGVATVDLSAAYASGGGSMSVFARLAQLVYTLTAFPTVGAVRLALDGTIVTTFPTGEGLVLDVPMTRTSFDGQGLVPPVFADRPAWGGTFGHRLVGATVGVTAFTVEVKDVAGAVLASQPVTAPDGVFDVNVPYVVAGDQRGTVTVYVGTSTARQYERSYPVTLLATAGQAWVRTLTHTCLTWPTHPFTDVPPQDVHALAVAVAYRWALVNGVGPTTFAPLRLATREQAAAMVARTITAIGGTLPGTVESRFSDLGGSVHRLQVLQLAQVGVVGGFPDGTFRPGGLVTRAQLMTMLQRAYQLRAQVTLGAPADLFTDDLDSVHHSAVNALAAAGVAGGYADGTFHPAGKVTREQLASFLARLVDLLVSQGYAAPR